MFTVLIPYPLWANRNLTSTEPALSSLILEFPEALYFWIPNYYFNLFLQKHHPRYARYRPFIADILRYDFQIEEAHSQLNSLTTQNSDSFSNPSVSRVLDLALYIKHRYLSSESKCFCGFEEQPEVLESIREKY